jgi:hypothetical protein
MSDPESDYGQFLAEAVSLETKKGPLARPDINFLISILLTASPSTSPFYLYARL